MVELFKIGDEISFTDDYIQKWGHKYVHHGGTIVSISPPSSQDLGETIYFLKGEHYGVFHKNCTPLGTPW